MIRIPSFSEILAVSHSRGALSEAPGLWKDLVGWWPFQEGGGTTAYDLSGWGNDGTLTAMEVNVDWTPCQKGMALDFDSNESVMLPGNSYDFGLVTAGTFAALVKVDTLVGALRHIFFDYSALKGMALRFQNADQFEGYIYPNNHRVTVDNVIAINTWYHVAMTFRSSGSLRLYLNGQPVGTPAAMGGDSMGDSALNLGIGYHNDVNYGFDGLILCPAIWNRECTPKEIAQLYADPWAMGRIQPRAFKAGAAPTFGGCNVIIGGGICG